MKSIFDIVRPLTMRHCPTVFSIHVITTVSIGSQVLPATEEQEKEKRWNMIIEANVDEQYKK